MQTPINESPLLTPVAATKPTVTKHGFQIRFTPSQPPRAKQPGSRRSNLIAKAPVPSSTYGQTVVLERGPTTPHDPIPPAVSAAAVPEAKVEIPAGPEKEVPKPTAQGAPEPEKGAPEVAPVADSQEKVSLEEKKRVCEPPSERPFCWSWYRDDNVAAMLSQSIFVNIEFKQMLKLAALYILVFFLNYFFNRSLECSSYAPKCFLNHIYHFLFALITVALPWAVMFPQHFATRRFTVRSREEVFPRHPTGDLRNDIMTQTELLHRSQEVVVEYGEQMIFFAPVVRIIYTLCVLCCSLFSIEFEDVVVDEFLPSKMSRRFAPPRGIIDHPARFVQTLTDWCSSKLKWRRLVVSRAALCQLANAYNLSYDSDESVVWKRLHYDAAKLCTINIDKDDWASPNGKASLQDSALIAYGYYRSLRQQRAWMDFCRASA